MFCDRRLANFDQWSFWPPEDVNVLVPREVRRSVVFLGRGVGSGWKLTSTAFLVSHPIEGGDSRLDRAGYLVTANHCLPSRSTKMAARVNRTDGTAALVSLPDRWWRHPAGKVVDVAVTPLPPLGDEVDAVYVPSENFITEVTLLFELSGVGDEVFITGLFSEKHGDRRNTPIVRIGNLALRAAKDEPIPTSELGRIEVHLVEVRSMRGLSGSPVFIRRTVRWTVPNVQNPAHGPLEMMGYGPDFHFLGLVQGHWELPAGARQLILSPEPKSGINVGIAMVVPAEKILEVLLQPELRELRDRELEAKRQARPVLD